MNNAAVARGKFGTLVIEFHIVTPCHGSDSDFWGDETAGIFRSWAALYRELEGRDIPRDDVRLMARGGTTTKRAGKWLAIFYNYPRER
jgi:hypothetical protein